MKFVAMIRVEIEAETAEDAAQIADDVSVEVYEMTDVIDTKVAEVLPE